MWRFQSQSPRTLCVCLSTILRGMLVCSGLYLGPLVLKFSSHTRFWHGWPLRCSLLGPLASLGFGARTHQLRGVCGHDDVVCRQGAGRTPAQILCRQFWVEGFRVSCFLETRWLLVMGYFQSVLGYIGGMSGLSFRACYKPLTTP